jgi:DNA-binding transcriptional MerR regulator
VLTAAFMTQSGCHHPHCHSVMMRSWGRYPLGDSFDKAIIHNYTKEMKGGIVVKRRSTKGSSLHSDEQKRIPKYPIGVVAQLVGIPPQTLRRYEEAGLLDPARQDGKNRLYSDENLEILEEIAALADEGVNAVGIRHILQIRRQVVTLQQEITEVRTTLMRVQTTSIEDRSGDESYRPAK